MLRHALLTLLLAPAVLPAAPELKGDPEELTQYLLDEKRVVSITAHGESKVQADRIVVTLRVKTKESAFVAALKSNRQVRTKLSQQLQQAGITPDRISAAKFSSVPNYGFFGDKPSSYEISNDVSVVVRGEDDMSAIAQAVDGMKEVSYLAAQFEDSNKKAHQSDALNEALAGVASQKAAYEKALGITLAPLRVNETSYQRASPPMAAPVMYDKRQAASTMQFKGSEEFEVSGDAGDESSSGFGELRYESNVTAEYLAKPR